MTTPRVLLIYPYSDEAVTMERKGEVNEAFGTYAPLGLLYIAAFLRKHFAGNVDVRVVDCQLGRWDEERVAAILREYRPTIVGLSTMTPMLRGVLKILRATRKHDPNIVTVLGGPHVTSFRNHTLCHPEIDFAIAGYGELSTALLIEQLMGGRRFRSVPGLIYREGADVKINPVDDAAVAIDAFPFPDRSLIDLRSYRCPVGVQNVMATVMSSRGCPYPCTFCNSPDKIHRERSIENVIDELRELEKLGTSEVFFFDDLFALRAERILGFCESLAKSGLRTRWAMKARIHTMTRELAREMRKAGCERVHFGIEADTDEMLRTLKKGVTVAQIRDSAGWCYEAGIKTVGSFMINLPGDTPGAILRRFEFVNSLKLDYCQYAILVAYNHSEIFEEGVRRGDWPGDLWLRYAADPAPDFVAPILDNGISREELDRLLSLGMRRFYFRPSYMVQRLRRVESWAELRNGLNGILNMMGW